MAEGEQTAWADWVAALCELENPVKASNNPHFKTKYADLASIMAAVRPVLAKHNLGLSQPLDVAAGVLTVVTTVLHASGQVVATSAISSPAPENPQHLGSKITYLRRYAVSSLLALAADEDDDANAVAKAPKGRTEAPRAQEAAPVEIAGEEEHHPSWEPARKSFCTAVSRAGFKYDDVALFAETKSKSKKRPSSMTTEERGRLLQYVISEEGMASVKRFIEEVQGGN